MVFYLIGLGLGDEKDISVKGLEIIQNCEEIYLEAYTSILGVNKEALEQFYEKQIVQADRDMCENGIDQILQKLSQTPEQNVAFLVVGDPFCATTHADMYLRAVNLGLQVQVVHNASIVNAVGCSGLQVYRFGEVVSVPFFTDKWKPYSFYNKIAQNRKNNLHTLVLLDIKVKEQNQYNLFKGNQIYQPPRFMDCKTAVLQILESEEKLALGAIDEKTKCFGLARIGFQDQNIQSGFLKDFLEIDMGPPLHSFIIASDELHDIQEAMFKFYLPQK